MSDNNTPKTPLTEDQIKALVAGADLYTLTQKVAGDAVTGVVRKLKGQTQQFICQIAEGAGLEPEDLDLRTAVAVMRLVGVSGGHIKTVLSPEEGKGTNSKESHMNQNPTTTKAAPAGQQTTTINKETQNMNNDKPTAKGPGIFTRAHNKVKGANFGGVKVYAKEGTKDLGKALLIGGLTTGACYVAGVVSIPTILTAGAIMAGVTLVYRMAKRISGTKKFQEVRALAEKHDKIVQGVKDNTKKLIAAAKKAEKPRQFVSAIKVKGSEALRNTKQAIADAIKGAKTHPDALAGMDDIQNVVNA